MKMSTKLKARMKNMAEINNVPAQAVLQNFMLERLLERISLSKYQDKFILKGGLLIASLVGLQYRSTMDMDTTLRGFPLREDTIRMIVEEICCISIDDEIKMVLNNVKPIREDEIYGGFRAAISARYENIIVPLKIDITTGDPITPAAIAYVF